MPEPPDLNKFLAELTVATVKGISEPIKITLKNFGLSMSMVSR